jgi:single-strand DNA-binding protein
MALAEATIIGHLGRDPETRFLNDGKPVCNFSVAVNEKRGGQESTAWYRISAFGKLAEVCGQHLGKGQQVYVRGRLQQRTYKDKDGAEKLSVEVVADSVQFLGGKGERAAPRAGGEAGGPGTQATGGGGFIDEDLPFDVYERGMS